MVDVLRRAFIKAIEETLEETPRVSRRAIKNGFISTIEILQNGERIPVYLIVRPLLLQALAERLLGEMEPDENTLIDLSNELSNLVVGVAKVIGSEEGEEFNISTPQFLKVGNLKPVSDAELHFKTSHSFCSIYIGSMRG
ncbi:MAG: chemotaxis protein CheX [Wolinella sp.]